MTEHHLFESAIGLAGRLSHIPSGADRPEDCGWRSSRSFTRNAPVFRVLGHYKTWISPEPDRVADSLPLPGTGWEQSRRQQRWLVKRHPEASLGNHMLRDFLAEEDSPFSPPQEQIWHTCFFSFGELTDTSLWRNTGVPLVVTVAGSANNILRLAKLDQERWTWHREPNVAARLVDVGSEKPALWIDEDLGPIRRVKCIVDLKRYNPTRWLAVQRDSGTTIFQPEYRKVPVSDDHERDASRIAANPLFRLSKEQTGGNTHSDVSFNPGTRSTHPQVAIIDERGFWSIWDVKHTKLKPSGETIPRLKVCGHIDRGILEQFPYRDRSAMRWHKVLWVGRSEDNLDLLGNLDLDADNEDSSSQAAFPQRHRSSSLLVCNPQQVRLFDLITGVYLPDLEFRLHDSLDNILDIQVAHDPQYFYVLTTSKLFIVRIYSTPGVEWDKPEKVWTVLFSTPHYRSSFDQNLKLAITPGIKTDQTTSFVFVYSSTNPWIDLFYVEFLLTDLNGVRCQANVTGLGSLQKAFNSAIRTFCISPTPIVVKTHKPLKKIGRDLVKKQVKLYQILALRSDMSLVSVLCVFSLSSSVQINVPSIRVGSRSTTTEFHAGSLQRLSAKFVVDDTLVTPEEDSPSVAHRYIKVFYEHLSRISAGLDQDSPAESAQKSVSRYNPFNAAHQYVEEAVTNGMLPTPTLFQIMPNFKEVSKHAIDWENEIEKLNYIHPSVMVYTLDLLHSRLSHSISGSPQGAYLKLLEISNRSLHHGDSDEANEGRIVSISEQIAYDLYLSLYGIGYANLTGNQPQASVEEDMLLDSQTETLPSSPPRLESPISSTWSQRSNSHNSQAVEDEDPAMTLVRAYTGTGRFVPEKKFELLDKWKLGVEPSDYVFDLDRSGDVDAGKLRREKQLAREERKRRRTQTLVQLSQEPELPATQPAPDTRFYSSQPRAMSSQSQKIHSDPLLMMSQPTAGAFGRRPNKKVKKRKGGF
ncbi:RNA polymerase I-specific transcription initiation factor RRN6-like protein [Xylaria sp. FL1777]|nr:RNA polymerase I-specific transcription initiation factor RRN6-like protein [Xylaria sp. FL1777]